ncbi:MAG: PRC-barrel domain-containing protein [Patescibacteria group bacterium]|nr:PRC-barrel domain-containing protein [Patescibacteria group bacterium]
MFINVKKLMDLPVYTESGDKLGKIFDIKLDVNTHAVSEYSVRESFLNKQIYLIKTPQVKEITADKVVVEDAIIKEKEKSEPVKDTAPVGAFGGAMMSKNE